MSGAVHGLQYAGENPRKIHARSKEKTCDKALRQAFDAVLTHERAAEALYTKYFLPI